MVSLFNDNCKTISDKELNKLNKFARTLPWILRGESLVTCNNI